MKRNWNGTGKALLAAALAGDLQNWNMHLYSQKYNKYFAYITAYFAYISLHRFRRTPKQFKKAVLSVHFKIGLKLSFKNQKFAISWPTPLFFSSQASASATCFRDHSTLKTKKNLLSPGQVSARRSCRYKIRRNTKFVLH